MDDKALQEEYLKKYMVVFIVTCFLSLFGNEVASANLELTSNKEHNLIQIPNKKMTPDYGEYYADLFYIPTGESVYSSSKYKIEMNINGNLVQLNKGSLDDSGGVISVSRYTRYGKTNDVTTLEEYSSLVENSMLPKEAVDYLSDLRIIDEGDKMTIYSQSKYGKASSVNSFDL